MQARDYKKCAHCAAKARSNDQWKNGFKIRPAVGEWQRVEPKRTFVPEVLHQVLEGMATAAKRGCRRAGQAGKGKPAARWPGFCCDGQSPGAAGKVQRTGSSSRHAEP